MFKKLILTMVCVAFLVSACSWSLLKKDNVVFQEGQHTWVKIEEANDDLEPFNHPVDLSAEDIERALSSITYFKPGFFSITGKEGDEYDLFTDKEIDMIAAPIAEAFSRAGSTEWIDFSVYNFRGQAFLGNFIITDGVMFIKDGEFNVAFRNMAVKAAPDSRELNTLDPTKSYREFRKVVPHNDQDKIEDNWLALNLDSMKAQEKEATPPEAEAEAEASDKGPPAEERPAKERLKYLQELYDEGLITEEEYKKKRKEILEDL